VRRPLQAHKSLYIGAGVGAEQRHVRVVGAPGWDTHLLKGGHRGSFIEDSKGVSWGAAACFIAYVGLCVSNRNQIQRESGLDMTQLHCAA
jgi:hypothetical protein